LHTLTTDDDVGPIDPAEATRLKDIQNSIAHASHLLPAQGPIEVFVHHNTLHAFEDYPFHDALRSAHKIYGAEPYLQEQSYRDMLDSGRIRIADLKAVLEADLAGVEDEWIEGLGSIFDLRMAMLQYPMRTGPDAELNWVIAETDALSRFRPEVSSLVREQTLDVTEEYLLAYIVRQGKTGDSHDETLSKLLADFGHGSPKRWDEPRWEAFTLNYLWRVCQAGVNSVANGPQRIDRPVRVRDILLEATGEDTDRFVHELLIRFCAAFLDQGYADWELPDRDAGLFRSFTAVFGERSLGTERWLRELHVELQKLTHSQAGPLKCIDESLSILGIDDQERDSFIAQSLLALRGWTGMIWQLESAADWVDHPVPKGSLDEFLAVRLVLDRLAAEYVGREFMRFKGPLNHLSDAAWERVPKTSDARFQKTFLVFQVAQSLGWPPDRLASLAQHDWETLINEIDSFDELSRRRVFQDAFERKYRKATLNALAIHTKRRWKQANSPQPRPSFQIVCCIDDREESFRRHLEEIDPLCETFGAAGFFAIAMNYQGAADAHYKPLCPVIITPKHFVREDVGYTFGGEHRRRAETRRVLGRFTHQVHSRSRTFFGGFVTALFGSLAAFPLVTRVLFPRLTSQMRRRLGRFVQPPPVTQLQLERYKSDPGPTDGHVGYHIDEMVELVERLLRDIGLLSNFSRIVVITGHGSSSINNPHESAYNCGACAGKRGGPNARAFAQMANDWRVRARLADLGVSIPDDTAFVGSYHNTCDDSVIWYDLDRLPPSHREDFERTKANVDQAQLRNAHERCRRFRSAPLDLTPAEALRHVEQRSEDLSQVRPEYNHATDALCFVGRRAWSRGLFLDRRAFLTSYDPTVDDENHSVLLRILSAAIPVCAGINLEYYFSRVDNVKYGAGSKLPHNIASLLGVMEGAISDLRTGLYQQMVEIHEPMRLLFVIESTAEAMFSIMERHEGIGRLCRGEWIHLALLNAETSELQLFRNGSFEPFDPTSDQLPVANSSIDWYRGQRTHLDFATIKEPVAEVDLGSRSSVASGQRSVQSVESIGQGADG